MQRIDNLIANQLCKIINYTLSRIVKPDIEIEKVTELDELMIKRLKEKYKIDGVILDVDDTLRKNMRRIPKCNEEWIERLKGHLKVIIVSNGKDKNIEEFFRNRGIDYINFAHKPLKRNFLKACEKMKIEPHKVLVVGNSLFDDIYGGKRNKMATALVRRVEEDER